MEPVNSRHMSGLVIAAINERLPLLDEDHRCGLRLFNGFLEGQPELVIDLYGRTLVLHNYADQPVEGQPLMIAAQENCLQQLPWLKAIVLKTHRAALADERRGQLVYGDQPDREIKEHGVRYAVNLTMNQDASFYLDTRNLRKWLLEHMAGKTLLNTFAYTGSLGVAALAGGAQRVVQTDLNRKFLNLAKTSYTLNGFAIRQQDFLNLDFYQMVGHLKSTKAVFDSVIIDPPFFSSTPAGKVDLVNESHRLINKVRPLIAHNGWLIAMNNALFLKGEDYLNTLESLCADGYLKIEEMIPVPEDITGYPATCKSQPPADPAPFNHSTKIAILRVTRKTNHSI